MGDWAGLIVKFIFHLVEVEVEAELGKNGNNQQRVFAKCFYHRLKGST